MLSTEIFVSDFASVWAPPHTPPLRRWSQGPGNMRTGWLRGLVGRPPWGVFIDFLTRLGQIVPPPSPPPAGDGGGRDRCQFCPPGPGGSQEGLGALLGGSRGSWGVPGGSWEGLGRVLRGVPGGLGALLGRIGRNPAEYLKVNKNLRQMNDLWGPGGPQMAPKRPHVGPKPPPNRPRRPLRPPKTAQEAPKTAQEGVPGAFPTCLHGFFSKKD